MKQAVCPQFVVTARFSIFLLGLLITFPAFTDDTEIYFAGGGEAGSPNILFVLDASGSMEQAPDGTQLAGGAANENSRFSIMKNALTTVLSNVNGVNVGLLDYGGARNPGYEIEKARANGVKYPVSPAGNATTSGILSSIDDLGVGGYTPIVEALYEATRYFRGMSADYGFAREPRRRASLLATQDSADTNSTMRVFTGCAQRSGSCENTAAAKTVLEDLIRVEGLGYYSYAEGSMSDLNCKASPVSECVGGEDEAGVCRAYAPTGETTNWCSYEYTIVSNKRYISPIANECQQNSIVLLSDGEPDNGCLPDNPRCVSERSTDEWVSAKVAELTQQSSCAPPEAGLADGLCGEELVDFLVTEDQSPELDGEQKVNTYVVGFAVEGAGRRYLESLARPPAGNVGFYTANDESALAQALTNITLSIINRGSSFNPPTISLNLDADDRSSIFIPLFEPSRSPRWSGNLKRYALDTVSSPPRLVDSEGEAVLDQFGNIVDTARSFWLAENADDDGGHVASGGAASLLGTNRNIFTNTESDQLIALTTDNLVDTDWFQPAVSATELSDDEKTRLIRYAQGFDEVSGGSRAAMGDFLHSRPVMVDYGVTAGVAEETESDLEEAVVFAGSNEGYLHAIRASDGEELFAFMPRMLLPNLNALYANSAPPGELGAAEHPYGVDGPIAVWRNDVDGNGVIDPEYSEDKNENLEIEYYEREFVWVFFGLRRGGSAYYALDVTDPVSPEIKWVIRDSDTDFARLGQSWSQPVRTLTDLDGDAETLPVPTLFFGGGYDPAQDSLELRQADNDGNAIYAVNPDTGERIWWASSDGADLNIGTMVNSIPSNIRVIDIDENGVADRLYSSDIGGRIFRIDLPDSANTEVPQDALSADGEATAVGMLFADLSADDSIAANRRFYYEPDVSIISSGSDRVAAIAIGSGYRAHPLLKAENTAQDRLYVLRDPALFSVPPEDTAVLTHTALTNITESHISREEGVDVADGGWYLNLDKENGEKALARAVTFNNTVFFTTFLPETTASANACSYASHTGAVYVMKVLNGDPVIRFSDLEAAEESELTLDDRKTEVPTADILSEVYFNVSGNSDGEPVVDAFVGAKFDRLLSRETLEAIKKIYWQEDIDN